MSPKSPNRHKHWPNNWSSQWLGLWRQQLLPYLGISLILPILLGAGYGLYQLSQQGWLVLLLAISFALGLLLRLLLLVYRLLTKAKRQQPSQAISLAADPNWQAKDQAQYQQLALEILPLSQTSSFTNWYSDAQHIFKLTAQAYQCHPLDFSLDQCLALIGQLAQDYQQQLQQQLPLVAKTKLSWGLFAYQQQQRFAWLGRAWQTWRKVRILTPTGLVKELEARMLTDRMWDGLEQQSKQQALQLLHQYFLQAAVQLYGNYSPSRLAEQPVKVAAPTLAPLRIALMGQVNAGKSSLINALGLGLAETSLQHCTPDVRAYSGQIGGLEVEVLDLPGYGSSPIRLDDGKTAKLDKEQQSLVKQLQQELPQADLIWWLLQANQPAKQADQSWRQWLARLPDCPPILGLLTHADRLPTQALPDALAYNQQLLDLPELLPLSLAATNPSNEQGQQLQALAQWLSQNQQRGAQQQLRRRRLAGQRFNWQDVKAQGQALVNTLRDRASKDSS